MRQSRPTLHTIERDLNQAWKLLNHLAETLTRIASNTAALSKEVSANTKTKGDARIGRARIGRPKKVAGKETARNGRDVAGLPDTAGDFFARHVKKRKQTASRIFQSVIESLGFELTKEQSAVLRNRLNVWLANAVKSQSNPISSVGAGKERQYYRS